MQSDVRNARLWRSPIKKPRRQFEVDYELTVATMFPVKHARCGRANWARFRAELLRAAGARAKLPPARR